MFHFLSQYCTWEQQANQFIHFTELGIRKRSHSNLEASRVDVSETCSADQFWFRMFSGLFQHCSFAENFWTALIQLWTAVKTKAFGAKNQRWTTLTFDGFRMTIFSHFKRNFKIFRSTTVLRHISQILSPNCETKLTPKSQPYNLLACQKYSSYSKVWVFCHCSCNKIHFFI